MTACTNGSSCPTGSFSHLDVWLDGFCWETENVKEALEKKVGLDSKLETSLLGNAPRARA